MRNRLIALVNIGSLLILLLLIVFTVSADLFLYVLRNDGSDITEELDYDGLHDKAFDIAVATDGTFVVVGTAQDSPESNDSTSFWMMRFDADGEKKWQKVFNGQETGTLYLNSATLLPDDTIAVGGYFSSQDNTGLVQLHAIDDGEALWDESSHSSNNSLAAIQSDDNGNIYTCGHNSDYKLIVEKVHPAMDNGHPYGALSWKTVIDMTEYWKDRCEGECNSCSYQYNFCYAVDIDKSGNVYIGAQSVPCGGASRSGLVAKLNQEGVLQWRKTFDNAPPNSGAVRSLKVDDNDGSVLALMNTIVSDGNSEYSLFKLQQDESGIPAEGWENPLQLPKTDYHGGNIVYSGSEDKYVIGIGGNEASYICRLGPGRSLDCSEFFGMPKIFPFAVSEDGTVEVTFRIEDADQFSTRLLQTPLVTTYYAHILPDDSPGLVKEFPEMSKFWVSDALVLSDGTRLFVGSNFEKGLGTSGIILKCDNRGNCIE